MICRGVSPVGAPVFVDDKVSTVTGSVSRLDPTLLRFGTDFPAARTERLQAS